MKLKQLMYGATTFVTGVDQYRAKGTEGEQALQYIQRCLGYTLFSQGLLAVLCYLFHTSILGC
jgi:hypothetical protein